MNHRKIRNMLGTMLRDSNKSLEVQIKELWTARTEADYSDKQISKKRSIEYRKRPAEIINQIKTIYGLA